MPNESPYFRHLGMVITELGVGEALVEIRSQVIHHQIFGNVHGGVIASLVDTAIFWCFFGELDETAGITTVDLKVNYLAPVADGKLSARGSASAWAAPLGSARRKSSTARESSSPTAPHRSSCFPALVFRANRSSHQSFFNFPIPVKRMNPTGSLSLEGRGSG